MGDLEARLEAASLTELVERLGEGRSEALDGLFSTVYRELHALARHYLGSERSDHTLQPTALVHEAYLTLRSQGRIACRNRSHFVALAACTMRRVLVRHARSQRAAKRGDGVKPLPLIDAAGVTEAPVELLALDDALERLARIDPRPARIMELRYFGGLTVRETSRVMKLSRATVERESRMARAWLHREMGGP